MSRKLRIRKNEIDPKLMLIKLLPIIFMLLILLAVNGSGLISGSGAGVSKNGVN